MPSVIMHTTLANQNNVPAFLMKLWRLVEENSCDDLICWSTGGTTFYIRDQSRFAKELLPLYFKHNNMASFIRQLNMYGFRKVVNIEQGGLRAEKDEYEFQHMYFLKGHEYLLELIKRKIPTGKGQQPQEELKIEPDVLGKMLLDVKQLHGKQENLDVKLASMKSENEVLWREVVNLRQQHQKQQQIVNKLVQFLLSLVHPKRSTSLGVRRKIPLMLSDVSHSAAKSPRFLRSFSVDNSGRSQASNDGDLERNTVVQSGPVIHDITDTFDAEAFFKDEIELIPTVASPFLISGNDEKQESEAVAGTSSHFQSEPNMELRSAALQADTIQENPPAEQPKSLTDINNVVGAENSPEALQSTSAFDNAVFKASDILVPFSDKDMNRLEFEDHLNSLQLELDTLKDFLSGSGCTIDPVSLLGVCPSPFIQLFTNDDIQSQGLMESMNDFGNSSNAGNEIVGTEVTQYNPNILELGDDVSIFDSESILTEPLDDNCLIDPLLDCVKGIVEDGDGKAIQSPISSNKAILESNADDKAILLSIPETMGESLYPTDSNEDIIPPTSSDGQLPVMD